MRTAHDPGLQKTVEDTLDTLLRDRGPAFNAAKDIPYSEFLERLEKHQLVEDPKHPVELVITEGASTQTVRGLYSESTPPKVDGATLFRTTVSVICRSSP